MKKVYEDRIGFDFDDDPFNGFGNKDFDDDSLNDDSFEEIDDINTEEELKHLCSLLREMFKNKGIYNVSVYNEDMNIIIDAIFNKTAKLEKIIEIFSIANKIKKEILLQYIDSFQMYEEKNGDHIISFEFIFDVGNSGYDYNDGYDGLGGYGHPDSYPYY